ncbi:MAG: hypothetical protein AAGG11_22685 [Pseudomonadota bacterium]
MSQLPDAATPYSWPVLGDARVATALVLPTADVPPAAGDPATVLPEERRAAREQGYAEGLRQGRDEAQAEQAAVLAELKAAAVGFVDELRAEKARARDLLRWLLQTLAEELSVQQLNRSPELLDRLLDEAVTAVGLPSQGLVVCVAPGLETWWQENEFRDDVSVQIDDGLAPGTVQLRSPSRVAEFDPRALVTRLLRAAPQDDGHRAAGTGLTPDAEQPAARGDADVANDAPREPPT